ncbi:MAG: AraC family transcriptional regulator [Bryobacterales bacterium]|nr:AraC family transcriptional regulator [Bryobacterales bacterium]
MSVTKRAIWYIECHLDGELSLASIAQAASVSRFHLSRAFAVSTMTSLAGYVRARRLSEAAKALAQGAPDILALALDAGYGSHEAFTRAFRQQFGLTPEQLRANGALTGIPLQEPFEMDPATHASLAPPRLVESEALLIFGLGQQHQCQSNAAIPSQWSSFLPHFGHIQGQTGNVAFGVICNWDDAGSYDYICGVQVPEFPAHPPEFTRLRIPPARYAVFEHHGHVSAIAATWKAVWERGLADAGYKATDGPALERYGEEFNGQTGLGGMELWVPVRS